MKRLTTVLLITVAAFTPARAQWTEPVRIGEPGAMQYPQVLAQGDTLHVVYTSYSEGWKIGYLRSTDRGDMWSNQHVLSDTVNTTQTRLPRIIKRDNALITLWLAYFWEGVYNYNIGWSVSYDNGITWSDPEYVLSQNWRWPFYLTASGWNSTINVMTSWGYADTMYVYNIRSTDFGQSWSEPVRLFTAAQGGSTAQATSASIVHYAWSGRFMMDDKIEIFYGRSTDDGINWSPMFALSDSDQYHSQLPALAGDDLGNMGATWMDFMHAPPGATGDIFLRQSADSGSHWAREIELTSNHNAFRSDLTLNADTVLVVWEDASLGLIRRSIYFTKSTDGGASWGEPYRLDTTLDESRYPALTASNGRVYVVWADGSEESGFGLYFSRYDQETRIADDRPIVPVMIRLRAYPNPFNSNVAIYLDMQKGGEAEITIYDVSGRLVKRLFKGGNLQKGTHKFTWDATDAEGKAVSSGLYFAVATTPQGKISKALTLIR